MRVLNQIGPRILVYPDMRHKPTREWILGKPQPKPQPDAPTAAQVDAATTK